MYMHIYYNNNNNLEYGWIGTSSPYSTNWIFYDYEHNANICDIDFIQQYNITQNGLLLNHNNVYKYQLFETQNKYITDQIWNNQYLMFEISSTAETWIKFETESQAEFIIEPRRIYQSKLLFTFNYNTKGITHQNATVYIISRALNLNYSLRIDYINENMCSLCHGNTVHKTDSCSVCEYENIEIILSDYYDIAMHTTFDSEYEILFSSNELLLTPTTCMIKRTDFMSLCPSNNENNSDILIKQNHWIAVYGYSDYESIHAPNELFTYENKNKTFGIISSVSANIYAMWCCQEQHGCYRDENSATSSKLCALNRDENSILCGQCLAGYSEVYGSQKCNENNYVYLLIIVIGLLYAICISISIQ